MSYAVMRRTCIDCGETFTVEVSANASPLTRRMLDLVRVCTDCGCIAEQRAAEKREAAAFSARVARSALPGPMRATFETYDVDETNAAAVEAARRWARGYLLGLVLTGPVGTGKTRLAATAAWEALQSRACRWVPVPELVVKLGAAFTDEMKYEAIRVLVDHRAALVLDDLDKVKAESGWVRSNVFTSIDGQMQYDAQLLVTTNLRPGELASRFGEAITSRLVGYCEVHTVGGADRRLK
jgi:DNA replication protein DnaC